MDNRREFCDCNFRGPEKKDLHILTEAETKEILKRRI